MTTATTTTGFYSVRSAAPTLLDRLLLRASKSVESFALARMQRRATTPAAASDAASDERRTALALGAVGILPR
jgi:hypothetical protein